MTQWYVKDLSKLTGVSAQTLHHYDRIDLLKPSVRLDNGYRVYSEKDLLQLQQIIALKFFGFSLSQIKNLLTNTVGTLEHFSVQAQVLEQKARNLFDASQALKRIITDVTDTQSIPWETIIQLIEVYNMTQKLEHAWVKDIFTPDELKEYATFEAELKANSTPQQKAAFEKNWRDFVAEVKKNLQQDPTAAIGIDLGKQCMQLTNKLYGKKYAHLRTKKFEQGFAQGKGLEEVGFTPEIVAWLEKAMDAYWRERIYGILNQVGTVPSHQTETLWNEVLDDMYGDDLSRKKDLYDAALQDQHISVDAKKWLRSLGH